MSNYMTSPHPLITKLIEDGIISPRCRRFTLDSKAGGVVILTQEVFVTAEEFERLAEIVRNAQPQTVVINEMEQDRTLDITPLGKEWRERLPKP